MYGLGYRAYGGTGVSILSLFIVIGKICTYSSQDGKLTGFKFCPLVLRNSFKLGPLSCFLLYKCKLNFQRFERRFKVSNVRQGTRALRISNHGYFLIGQVSPPHFILIKLERSWHCSLF